MAKNITDLDQPSADNLFTFLGFRRHKFLIPQSGRKGTYMYSLVFYIVRVLSLPTDRLSCFCRGIDIQSLVSFQCGRKSYSRNLNPILKQSFIIFFLLFLLCSSTKRQVAVLSGNVSIMKFSGECMKYESAGHKPGK